MHHLQDALSSGRLAMMRLSVSAINTDNGRLFQRLGP